MVDRARKALDELGPALLAGFAFFPVFASTATFLLYLEGWPRGSGEAEVGVGAALGAALWLVLALLFCRPFARPESANTDVYEELMVRFTSLCAQVNELRDKCRLPTEITCHMTHLKCDLGLEPSPTNGGAGEPRRSRSP